MNLCVGVETYCRSHQHVPLEMFLRCTIRFAVANRPMSGLDCHYCLTNSNDRTGSNDADVVWLDVLDRGCGRGDG